MFLEDSRICLCQSRYSGAIDGQIHNRASEKRIAIAKCLSPNSFFMSGKSNLFSSRSVKVVAIVAVAGLLVFLNLRQVFNPAHRILTIAVYPFQKFFFQLSSSAEGVKDFVVSVGSLKKENAELFEQNQKLLVKSAWLSGVDEENKILREQLKLLPLEKYSLEGAFVTSRDPHGLGSWIEIDKGENFGLESGMPVIVSGGILIGKIGAVYSGSAQVILVSNSQSLVNAVDVQTGAKGIVRGEYQLGSVLDMVLQADTLNVGDEIVTAGSNENFPKGLLVGKVEKVGVSGDGLFQQALISLPVQFFRLHTVFVIKK